MIVFVRYTQRPHTAQARAHVIHQDHDVVRWRVLQHHLSHINKLDQLVIRVRFTAYTGMMPPLRALCGAWRLLASGSKWGCGLRRAAAGGRPVSRLRSPPARRLLPPLRSTAYRYCMLGTDLDRRRVSGQRGLCGSVARLRPLRLSVTLCVALSVSVCQIG